MFRGKHDRRLSVETEEHRTSLNWLQ
jgi:hypothetical protein